LLATDSTSLSFEARSRDSNIRSKSHILYSHYQLQCHDLKFPLFSLPMNPWKSALKQFPASNSVDSVFHRSSRTLSMFGSKTPLLDLGRLFSFLIHIQSVGLLGRGISPSQGRELHTEQHKHRTNAHGHNALNWIRTHDPSVRASEESSCLRLRGHCDRPVEHSPPIYEPTSTCISPLSVRHVYWGSCTSSIFIRRFWAASPCFMQNRLSRTEEAFCTRSQHGRATIMAWLHYMRTHISIVMQSEMFHIT
jgi:hypothetical protein